MASWAFVAVQAGHPASLAKEPGNLMETWQLILPSSWRKTFGENRGPHLRTFGYKKEQTSTAGWWCGCHEILLSH